MTPGAVIGGFVRTMAHAVSSTSCDPNDGVTVAEKQCEIAVFN